MRKKRRLVAPLLGLALLIALGGFAVPMSLKSPSHQRHWKPEYAVLPQAESAGDLVTIRNVRNFAYAPDGSVHNADYDDRSYDTATLSSMWYGISHFADHGLAHTFLSFGFENGEYLAISIEARQEVGESYHPIAGLLRNYELIYLAGDERDIIGLRSHIRAERVLLYRVLVDQASVRQMFRNMVERINEINEAPEFYNTLTDNCTTGILRYAKRLSVFDRYFDYRVLLPGYSDEVIYDLGVFATHLPLEELREQAWIDPAVTAIDDPEFSRRIRTP